MKRHSYKRSHLTTMREVFVILNEHSTDERKQLDRRLNYSDYNFAIEVIDKQIDKLEKNRLRVARIKGSTNTRF